MRIFKKISQFSKPEIDTAFKQAHRVLVHDGLTLLQSPAQKEYGRILIITPLKVGSAPERNKLRRQIKALFFENKKYEQPFDLIALVRAPLKDLSFNELQKLLFSYENNQ